MRKIILFLILMFSGGTFADTYPAQTLSASMQCADWGGVSEGYNPDQWSGLKCSKSGYPSTFLFDQLYCPVASGGSLSGTSCINAPSCTAPQIRNATTGACEAPPVTCNYTPTITTVGSTQTISWQTDNTATNSCTDNSVSCNAPLVANVEQKRCDLLCTDGTTVDVSGGAQCPPPVCVGGQTLNTATNTCEEPVCSSLQVLNSATHTCLDNAVCIGGQTQNTSTMPYSCNEPICTGLKLLNTTTHTCDDPAPAVCVGGQVLNTATNTCTDPVCPSGYHLNAGKVCENDGECPLFSTKTMVDGVLKCATTPTSTTTTTNGTSTTTATNPDSSSTTTTTNPDGTIITSTTSTPGTISTSTTTTSSTSDCPDCAKESTLREVAKKLDAKAGASTAGTGAAGQWYTSTDKTYESVLQDGLTQIQNTPIMSFGRDIFSVSIPGGTCPTWTIPSVMGMNSVDVSVLCGDLAELIWPIVSGILQFLAVLIAYRIALSAV